MAEAKKRFPWWLLVCAAILVPVAAVIGFIETVGRQGTVISRLDQIETGMSREEAHRILGPPDSFLAQWSTVVLERWDADPQQLQLAFYPADRVCSMRLIPLHEVGGKPDVWFRMRRWAEQAYTAIHGPRR